MAELKTYTRRNKQQQQHIDHIPNYFQRRRSPGLLKRRTDFSLFLSDSHLHHVSWTKNKDEIEGLLTNCVELPVIEVDSKQPFERRSERNVDKEREDTLTKLDFPPHKPQNTESSDDACTTPGSVVWSKKACEVWWPAEDFEERSCNPMEEFQDSLKQALNQKENPDSGNQSSNSPDCSNQQDQSTMGDKCSSSSSSRTEGDYLGRSGRSKRKIKPKLHFDDVMVQIKSPKKSRRLKIMRSLGLAAPVGSPFSPAADDIFTSC